MTYQEELVVELTRKNDVLSRLLVSANGNRLERIARELFGRMCFDHAYDDIDPANSAKRCVIWAKTLMAELDLDAKEEKT